MRSTFHPSGSRCKPRCCSQSMECRCSNAPLDEARPARLSTPLHSSSPRSPMKPHQRESVRAGLGNLGGCVCKILSFITWQTTIGDFVQLIVQYATCVLLLEVVFSH